MDMGNILSAILEVFAGVSEWFATSMDALVGIFYKTTEAGGDLTVFGVLAVSGLAISVTLLLFNLVKGFLRFS